VITKNRFGYSVNCIKAGKDYTASLQ